MSKVDRWVEGFAVRFLKDEFMKGIWIIRRVDGQNVTFANIDYKAVAVKSQEELSGVVASNDIQFLAEDRYNGEVVFQDLPEEDQLETVRKFAYVKAYIASEDKKRSKKKLTKLIPSVAREIGDEKPPAWNTLNNWILQYSNAGCRIKGLYPNHYKKGCRTKKLDPAIYKFIDAVMPRYYSLSKPLMSTIFKMVEAKILKHNLNNPVELLKVPAYSTISYHIRRKSYQQYIRGRVGSRRARYEFSSVLEAPKTSRILERVEADHTPLDIHVLHDDTKTLLGRPTLTALIDHYSGMIVGCQISFEEPSYASASLAIGCAILPKNEVLEFYGVEGSWPAHGVMESIVADNGSEFWSDNMEMAISEVGSVLQYAPVRRPNYKGAIERFFRTVITALLDALPGKINGVTEPSDDYKAAQEAKLTLSEFKRIFFVWLVNVYHRQPRGGKEKSPLDLWNESAGEFPVVEEDRKRIETILMVSDTRTLQRSGIQIERLTYNSDCLRDIYRREGVIQLQIKYSPFDLRHIYVFDELNSIYILVKCDYYEYASGLSMYAHKIILKRTNAIRKGYNDDLVLQRAKIELFANIVDTHDRNVRRKTQVTTKKSARVHSLGVYDIAVRQEEFVPVSLDSLIVEEGTDDWEVW